MNCGHHIIHLESKALEALRPWFLLKAKNLAAMKAHSPEGQGVRGFFISGAAPGCG
jgi:hypothetical protein